MIFDVSFTDMAKRGRKRGGARKNISKVENKNTIEKRKAEQTLSTFTSPAIPKKNHNNCELILMMKRTHQ